MNKDPMLTVREQAELVGLSKSMIHKMIKDKAVPWPLYQVSPTKKVAKKSEVLMWLEAVKVIPKHKEAV